MIRPLALGLAALAALVAGGCGATDSPTGSGAGSLPFDARSPLEPPSARMRVVVQFHRPSLADAMKGRPFAPGRQRAYVASLRDEAAATQSSLRAKGVRLERPVLYARVWNGFAATIRSSDLPTLRATGLRAEPVRRFFGAAVDAGGVPGAAARRPSTAGAAGKPSVALLDSGGDPNGAALARLLRSALGRGEGGVLALQVAHMRRDPQTGSSTRYGTTDELLEGLERAVDPNGDGEVTDHVPVALVGVNSPYAGFDDSPEAQAVAGASTLGTLVVAPAGNEGPSAGSLGTIGSPGAALDALTVGALEGGGAPALPSIELALATSEGRMKARGVLLGGAARPLRAPVAALAGPSQSRPRAAGRALGAEPLEYFGVDAAPRARGRVAMVPAHAGHTRPPALATRAAAAAQAGVRALVVCEPDPARPLPALPAGGPAPPVIGLRGEAARRALELTPRDGGLAFLSASEPTKDAAQPAPGRSSSRGPTYALAPKPDLVAGGTAAVDGELVAGTSVAAARVAAAAARLRAAKPAADPAEIAARLVETATPAGPALAAGAGRLDLARAAAATVVAEPRALALPRRAAGAAFASSATVTVRNAGGAPATLAPSASLPGTTASVAPARLTLAPGAARTLTVRAAAGGSGRQPGYLTGTLRIGSARARLALAVGQPPPARLSALALQGEGVRFTAGALTRRGEAVAVAPLGDLTLRILDASGAVVRELTPHGGARDLLPGEYAYTLTSEARSALARGRRYRFRATARGPSGGGAVVRTSPPFKGR